VTGPRLHRLLDAFNDGVPRLMLVVAALGVIGIVVMLAGCAAAAIATCHDRGARPYTSEHSVAEFHVTVGGATPMWFADNRAGTVLTVHNPTDSYVAVRVRCVPTDVEGLYGSGWQDNKWDLCLAPHQEKVRLVEFMYIDILRDVCHVEQAYAETAQNCVEND
jgi:hypothetical protein